MLCIPFLLHELLLPTRGHDADGRPPRVHLLQAEEFQKIHNDPLQRHPAQMIRKALEDEAVLIVLAVRAVI